MTFLNVSLVAGSLAFLLPLVIHLLNRTQLRIVDWGAMHLLESASEVQSRRFQWDSWILLLIRCLIPIVLAICLAQPIITVWKSPAEQNRTHVVWLIDDSFSMQAASKIDNEVVRATPSALQNGLASVREIIAGLGPEAVHSIVAIGAAPTDITGGSVVDWRTANGFLNSINATAGPCQMLDAFSTAVTACAQPVQPRRLIVLVSDFQQSQWSNTDESSWVNWGERFRAMDIPPQLVFLPIPISDQGNVSVVAESSDIAVVGVGQSMEITTTVRNHGPHPLSKLPVSIYVDDKALAARTLDLDGQATSQVAITCQFDTPGSHVVSVRLSDPGEVRGDDQAHVPVYVVEGIDVVIIADEKSSESNSISSSNDKSIEESYLRFSLAPFASGQTSEQDLVRVRRLSPDTFIAQPKQPSAIVLADFVPSTPAFAAVLRDYVSQGGTLIVFAGHDQQNAWYNEHLTAADPMLPFAYGNQNTSNLPQERGRRILRQTYDHPALALFNSPENGDLSKVEFYQWFRLEPSDYSSGINKTRDPRRIQSGQYDQSSGVIVSLDNGEPVLAERKYGRGSVFQFACSLNARVTNLTSRPVFVPLIQQLVLTSTISNLRTRIVASGQVFSVRTFGAQSPDPLVSSARQIEPTKSTTPTRSGVVVTPSGLRQEVELNHTSSGDLIQFTNSRVPGVYRWELNTNDPAAPLIEHFVATSSASESELATLSTSQMEKNAAALGSTIVHSVESFLAAERERRTGKEIWMYAFVLILVLMFAELLLQQQVGRANI